MNDKQYAGPVVTPILAKLMNDLYKVNAPTTNRDDLVAVFGTGVKGLNYTGDTVADMLRLNYSIPVTPAGKINRLGVIGGDNGGFPNGRRLGDDVVDAAERVMAGFLKGNKVELGDGVNSGDVPNLASFPYEAAPQPASPTARASRGPDRPRAWGRFRPFPRTNRTGSEEPANTRGVTREREWGDEENDPGSRSNRGRRTRRRGSGARRARPRTTARLPATERRR